MRFPEALFEKVSRKSNSKSTARLVASGISIPKLSAVSRAARQRVFSCEFIQISNDFYSSAQNDLCLLLSTYRSVPLKGSSAVNESGRGEEYK